MMQVIRREEKQIAVDELEDGRKEWVGGTFGSMMRAALSDMREAATTSIATASDAVAVYRLQGRIAAIDEIMGLDQRVLNALVQEIGEIYEKTSGETEGAPVGETDDPAGAGQRRKIPDIGDYNSVRQCRH
jgi:hypothetical protein